MLSLAELRLRHPRFHFDQVLVEHLEETLLIKLQYHLENGAAFTTTLSFPHITANVFAQKDLALIRLWATHIGMVDGMSYWKTACAPEWVIHVPGITADQLGFWDSLLKKGLSEFFYINQINAWQDEFVHYILETPSEISTWPKDTNEHQERALIPVGGGKDSVVTTELFREQNIPMNTFSMNSYPQLERVLETFWHKDKGSQHVQITRTLDPKLRELNAQGYLNGHTPFSATLAFISTLSAYLYDFRYVPLSNEWSANEGNTTFHGQTINHQYSKSLEFELLFRQHLKLHLSETIEYFSYLRPLHELQIAEVFVRYPQYRHVFLSCNRGQKRGVWCGECPKCLFVALMLAAFLSSEELFAIFGKDILNDNALRTTFDELAGFTEVKSLECVGTREETRAAVALAAERLNPRSALIEYGWQRLLQEGSSSTELRVRANQLRSQLATGHAVPEKFFYFLEKKVLQTTSL